MFKAKKQHTKYYDIARLRDDSDIAEKYSNKLKDIFLAAQQPDSVNTMHEVIVKNIYHATECTIPLKTKYTDKKPWALGNIH